MTPDELRKVLRDHATSERNRDNFFVLTTCLGALAGMTLSYIGKKVIHRVKDNSAKEYQQRTLTWEVE